MPELPEVETIRRGLAACLKGQQVKRIEVVENKSFWGEKGQIEGKRVKGIRRFGKALVFDFTGVRSIICHLRMTGQLIWVEQDRERFAGGHPNENFVAELPNKQSRVIIEFCSGARLFFNDQRKFGFMRVVETAAVEEDPFIQKLGKEPWQMDARELWEKLQKHARAAIKTVLLDQTVIAGLGNIYVDESLYFANIDPRRLAGQISLAETERILEGARTVMDKSLEAGGSTIRNYVKSDGTRGNYLDLFAEVYHREGKKCVKCGHEIAKIKLGGRGTHFCPYCQK